MLLEKVKENMKARSNSHYQMLYNIYRILQSTEVKLPSYLGKLLYCERMIRNASWNWLSSKIYYEPILRSRCTSVGKNVRCDGDIPLIEGNGIIIIGNNVFIGNKGAWFVSTDIYENATLKIGNNTAINYRTVISVSKNVSIGNYCYIAEETKIFDNNSHGIDYRSRRMTSKDVGPIVIEDHVWVGMNAIILKNVVIGKGSVVASGSVVTEDVPPMKVVGGNPAKIIKSIE